MNTESTKTVNGLNKKTLFLIIGISVIIALIAVFFIFKITNNKFIASRVIKVYELDGEAIALREGKSEIKISVGMNLVSGDVISLKSGTMTLKIDDDKYIYVVAGTEFELVASGNKANNKTVINQKSGQIMTEIDKPLSTDSTYEINTPNSSMAVRGTVFASSIDTDAKGDTHTTLATLHGQVAIKTEGSDTEIMVSPGFEISVDTVDGVNTFSTENPTPLDISKLPDSFVEAISGMFDENGNLIEKISREENTNKNVATPISGYEAISIFGKRLSDWSFDALLAYLRQGAGGYGTLVADPNVTEYGHIYYESGKALNWFLSSDKSYIEIYPGNHEMADAYVFQMYNSNRMFSIDLLPSFSGDEILDIPDDLLTNPSYTALISGYTARVEDSPIAGKKKFFIISNIKEDSASVEVSGEKMSDYNAAYDVTILELPVLEWTKHTESENIEFVLTQMFRGDSEMIDEWAVERTMMGVARYLSGDSRKVLSDVVSQINVSGDYTKYFDYGYLAQRIEEENSQGMNHYGEDLATNISFERNGTYFEAVFSNHDYVSIYMDNANITFGMIGGLGISVSISGNCSNDLIYIPSDLYTNSAYENIHQFDGNPNYYYQGQIVDIGMPGFNMNILKN